MSKQIDIIIIIQEFLDGSEIVDIAVKHTVTTRSVEDLIREYISSKESDTSKCKTCGIEKTRKFLKYSNDGQKVKKFANEKGKQWNGRKCPECTAKTNKNRAKRKYKTWDQELERRKQGK